MKVLLMYQGAESGPDECAEEWIDLQEAEATAKRLQTGDITDGPAVLWWEIWWNDPADKEAWRLKESWTNQKQPQPDDGWLCELKKAG